MTQKELKKIKIDLNAMASDIILVDDKNDDMIKNLMTGQTGSEVKQVIRNRRFILITKKHYDAVHAKVPGVCAIHDKETDSLICLSAVFSNGRWEEIKRCAFFWEDGEVKYAGLPGDYIGHSKAFDLMGQTFLPEEPKPKLFMHADNVSTVSSGYKDAVLSFFDDSAPYFEIGEFNRGNLELTRCDSLSRLYYCQHQGVVTKNWAEEDAGCYRKIEKRQMPGNSLKLMEKFSKAMIGQSLKEDAYIPNYIRNGHVFSVLENIDGTVYLRYFKGFYITEYPAKDTKVRFMEIRRLKISKEFDHNIKLNSLIYMDDMTGTFMEYTAHYLKEWLQIQESILSEKNWKDAYGQIILASERRSEETFVPTGFLFQFAKTLAISPVTEKLYNMEFEGNSSLKDKIAFDITVGKITSDASLEETFGKIEKGKSPNEILGIPKGLLEHAAKCDSFSEIGCIKELFFDENARAYLKRMNRNDAESLFDTIFYWKINNKHYNKDSFVKNIRMLFLMYGCENWKGYLRHMYTLMAYDDMLTYTEYLSILLTIGKAAKGADWKLYGEALSKSVESLKEAYALKSDTVRGQYADRIIREREPEFKDMCCENEDMIITYPRSTDDIIREGVALHHCAKDFMDKIVSGKTTLLFIRKKDKIDKPFYTLEVRGGAIRQCHGFDNANADDRVKEFLKEFCKKKEIIYREGNTLLGV